MAISGGIIMILCYKIVKRFVPAILRIGNHFELAGRTVAVLLTHP
jgi:hypothetical protein